MLRMRGRGPLTGEMEIGDLIETAIYGRVTISVIYESEAEARAAGYHSDAHVKGGDWPYTAWKVLYDGEAFAAVKVLHSSGGAVQDAARGAGLTRQQEILRGSTGAAQDTARDTRA